MFFFLFPQTTTFIFSFARKINTTKFAYQFMKKFVYIENHIKNLVVLFQGATQKMGLRGWSMAVHIAASSLESTRFYLKIKIFYFILYDALCKPFKKYKFLLSDSIIVKMNSILYIFSQNLSVSSVMDPQGCGSGSCSLSVNFKMPNKN